MEIKDQIQVHLDSGFTKSDLEHLMGLPINSLSGFFAGGRKYSKKNELRILRWLESEDKPDPLTLKLEVIRKPKKEVAEKVADPKPVFAPVKKETPKPALKDKPPYPERMEGEDALDFSARKNEYKRLYGS